MRFNFTTSMGEQLREMRLGKPKPPRPPQVLRKAPIVRPNALRERRLLLPELGHHLPTRDAPAQVVVPENVLADREARLSLRPASRTAELMGDPLPGRSALDKRR